MESLFPVLHVVLFWLKRALLCKFVIQWFSIVYLFLMWYFVKWMVLKINVILWSLNGFFHQNVHSIGIYIYLIACKKQIVWKLSVKNIQSLRWKGLNIIPIHSYYNFSKFHLLILHVSYTNASRFVTARNL